jgi:two-component system NtrC family sensor kinase
MARLSKTSSKASKAKARKASQTKGRKTAKTKRHAAPAAKPRKRRSVSELEAQLQLRTKELDEALARQNASAEILKVINASPGDLTPVFNIILKSAHSLCDVSSGSLQLFDGDHYRAVAVSGVAELFEKSLRRGFPITDRVRHPVPVQNADLVETLSRMPNEESLRAAVDLGGIRTNLLVPLVKDGVVIGRIVAARREVRPFTDKQIALLQSFADQAVIAIENARLFNETKEALERQIATSDILKVIASSPSDVQPVFEAIATNAKALIGGFSATVFRFVDGVVNLVAYTLISPAADEVLKASFPRPTAKLPFFELAKGGEVVQEADTETNPDAGLRELARARGFRSSLFSPLMSKGTPIGLIVVTRKEPGTFANHHVQLLQTFADQAVIAIENARLFNETREALERQTATADILKVIASSPSDVQPVFEAIATSSNTLIGGFSTAVMRFIGEELHLAAFTPTNPAADEVLKASFPRPLAEFPAFLLVRDGETVQFADTEAEDVPHLNRDLARLRGFRSMLFTPLISGGTPIGLISVTRKEPGPFAAHHTQLVRTFADQAVIAIENVRLFDEVQAKTHDLSEALTYQTGSANILSVIASSPTDVEPVLKAIVQSACELCDAYDAFVRLRNGNNLEFGAHYGPIPVTQDIVPISRGWTAGLAVIERRPVHVHDLLSSEGDEFPEARELGRAENHRTILSVPLMREAEAIGAIVLRRTEVHPFSDKQIALLQTFADQAVIAIENVRLFDEVQMRTEDLRESLQQQTATADVLKVISRSTFDLQTVLQTLVESAARLCDADKATITREKDGQFYRAEIFGYSDEFLDYVRDVPVLPERGSCLGRALLEGVAVHIPDVLLDPEYTFSEGQRLGGFRTMLGVPMLREGIPIGVVALTRSEPRPFTDKQIELVTTFADQAAIAIENVRLFESVEARTRELARSLEDLRTAQDRLVQTEKLASLGQLTAGIAHEIKNPLNFVNNFSALSAELTDELNGVLKPVAMDGKVREEVDELTGMLKDNLEKVVQHGKRADSIVKNMLLHSRQGSGEHRPVDINAIVDESLNLAYHGARAENTGFNIAMHRSFDPAVGMADGYPQEITRALLNLISNGFYAATKRKADADDGFEPTLTATTRNLGDKVEIRIRDNGTGIPAEVKEKIFNPFFTTKPAGEGTGLGLSMSHDIIVKQHGGRMEVETELGQFTEFRIVLPRAGGSLIKPGERS